MKKTFTFIILSAFLIFVFQILSASAVTSIDNKFNQGLEKTAGPGAAGYPIDKASGNPGAFLATMLGGVLMPVMTGVIAMLILSYAGYVWMMARGNEQQVEKARTIIVNTLIALIIIYSAFAIVKLVIPLWEFVTK